VPDEQSKTTDDRGEPLGDAERRALEVLEPELNRHGALTMFAFDVICTAVSRVPELPVLDVPLSTRVAVNLLVRLSNDLRCAALLALRGYAVQAASLVASMYEEAYTIAAIGSDDKLARQWVEHDDPTRTFGNVPTLTRHALAELGHPNPRAQARVEYRIYQQLCMPKHANPLFQMQHGARLRDGSVVAMNGPDTSEPAIRAAWFALEHAAALVFVALASFVTNHVPREARDNLMTQVKTIGAGRKELEAAGIKRWGSKDPFPGRWRVYRRHGTLSAEGGEDHEAQTVGLPGRLDLEAGVADHVWTMAEIVALADAH